VVHPQGEIGALPYAEQLAAVQSRLDRPQEMAGLLQVLGDQGDHEPLVHAIRELDARGQLEEPALARALQDLLLGLPDPALRSLLHALGPSDSARAAVLHALQHLPLERLAGLFLLERWLMRAHPEEHARWEQAALQACREGEPDDRDLLRVRGVQLRELAQRDAPRLRRFARTVLQLLEQLPKSLSQAHAEELLSRRVYTEPGHFLVELLQNADDARATRWHVSLQPGTVAVWHDGIPFDARDVVGVLSIGQTTKGSQQIGMFGVGFKSVHEVTDRPAVYCDPFQFEIATVSVPRWLQQRPHGHPDGGTLLVLPLREGVELAPLHRRALAVPQETLLTLRSLRSLAVRWGEQRYEVHRVETSEPGRVRLLGERASDYLVEREEREDKPVLVAIVLDEAGRPRALPPGAPTLFAFLPTQERSGLRLLVHAPFVLPVDRERIDLGSPSNREVLLRAGTLLGRLVARQTEPGVLDGLLSVLPLRAELAHPGLAALLQSMHPALAELAWLPGAAGERLSPRDAVVLDDPELVPVLAGMRLDGERRPLAALPPRERQLALELGGSPFGAGPLVSWVARALEGSPEGSPPWLLPVLLPVLLSVARHGGELLDRLRPLPLLPDTHGRLHPPEHLVRADAQLRPLWARLRPLLHERLDLRPTPAEEQLLRRLGARTWTADDLVDELRERGPHEVPLPELLEILASQPLTRSLGDLPLFPDARGRRHPLVGPERVWLSEEGPWDTFLRGLPGGPPLLDPSLARAHGAFLQRHGLQRLDPVRSLDGLPVLGPAELRALHRALASVLPDLSARACFELAGRPLFPDQQDLARPLRGEDRALLPVHPELVSLLPELPWLAHDLLQMPHLHEMGAQPIGPEQVADWLVSGSPRVGLREAYTYLAAHPTLPPEQRLALARAPIWQDEEGQARTLAALGLPPEDAALAELFRALGAPSLGPEALPLVRALHLQDQLSARTPEGLLDRLTRATAEELGPLQAHRELLWGVVRAAAARLPRERVARVLRAPLFRGDDGGLHPLAPWGARAPGCRRARGPLAPPLSLCRGPLLDEADEELLGSLLDELGARTAQLSDLLEALAEAESSPALWASVRASLVQLPVEVLRAHTARLEALPMWPTRDSRWLPSRQVSRDEPALDSILGEGWREDPELAVLDPSAEPEAAALSLSFASPLRRLASRLLRDARPGLPLAQQPVWLGSLERLLALLALLRRELPLDELRKLPLSLDRAGRLATGRLLVASPEEGALCEGLELHKQLADPAWASAALGLCPELCAPLLVGRLLAALHVPGVCATPRPLEGHPHLQDPERRATLYGWLLEHTDEIERDEQARGVLGRCCWVPTRDGWLRPPRELLLDEGLAEIVPGGALLPAGEVPDALSSWLQRLYGLESTQLPLVVGHLLEQHEAAVKQGDLERSQALLERLARLSSAPEAVKRLGLHRKLSVRTSEGGIGWPRTLMAPDPEDWRRLTSSLRALPARVAPQYEGEALSLLRAAGARPHLSADELSALMQDLSRRQEGPQAALAFAGYVARALQTRPELHQELAQPLARAPWMPDGLGAPRAPSELYWPEAETQALLGEDPARYPHPDFLVSCPEQVGRALKLRGPEQLALRDVLGAAEVAGASPQALAWLEQRLLRGLSPAELRKEVGERALFLDEQGVLRARTALVRELEPELFGSRRGRLAGGEQLPRLLEALGVPRQTGSAQLVSHLEQIATELSARGPQPLLAQEPELLSTLPRCLQRLAPHEPRLRPEAVPLVVRDARGQLTLCLLSDPRLLLQGEPARDQLAPLELDEQVRAMLRRSLPARLPPREPPPEPRLLDRFRRWWQPEEPPQEPARPPPPPVRPRPPAPEPPEPQRGARDHREWFRPVFRVAPQLDAAPQWLADRPKIPLFGFAFAPEALPAPYLYGPLFIGDRFDPSTQQWLQTRVLAEWQAPGPGEGATIALRGRVPSGEVVLPLPLYARLLEVDAGDARLSYTREGRPLLRVPSDREIEYTAVRAPVPDFRGEIAERSPPRALLEPTVPNKELPVEVHRFLERQDPSVPALDRALAVQDFVRERYRYDGAGLEDPDFARWLRSVTVGRRHRQIAMLHARRDGRHLGAGVCFELGALATELLRRSGVPAAVCTGWTFDRGTVSEPDHLWSLALLPTRLGLRWLPIDASTTRQGRPLHSGPRPPGPWRAPPPPARPGPQWDEQEILRRCQAMLSDPDKTERLLGLLREEDQSSGLPRVPEGDRSSSGRDD
jgi:hypothetical protein